MPLVLSYYYYNAHILLDVTLRRVSLLIIDARRSSVRARAAANVMPDVIIFNAFGADFAGLAVALRRAEGSGPVQTNESARFADVNDINALA